MAYTISHTIIAPAIYHFSRQQLPLAAIVIGCMLPDLTRFFIDETFSHHWLGMLSINLCFGILIFQLWQFFYRPVVYAFADVQAPIRLKLNIDGIFVLILALILGNASHLIWDGITHLDHRTFIATEFLSEQVPVLNIPMHLALQYASSIISAPLLYFVVKPFLEQVKIQKTSQKTYVTFSSFFSLKSAFLYTCVCIATGVFFGIYLYLFDPSWRAPNPFTIKTYGVIAFFAKSISLAIFSAFSLICLALYIHLISFHKNST